MEQGKRAIMIFISILTLIIVVSILFLVNFNLKLEEEETFKEASYNLTEKEIDSLINLIGDYDSYLITFDGTKNINTLSNLDKINFIDRLSIETKKDLNLDFDKGVSLNDVYKVLKKYFGPKTIFEPVNSTCYLEDGNYLIYDSNTKMYKADNDYHAHSAYIPPDIVNYYIEGKRIVDNDKLIYTITLKKAFAWPDSSTYYGSYNDLANEQSPLVDLYSVYGDYEKENTSLLLEDYKNNLNSYTYVFETKDSINNSYLIELTSSTNQTEF